MSKRTLFAFCSHLLLVLSLGLVLASCNQQAPTPKAPSRPLGPVGTWIRQHAIPLKTAEPGGSDVDLLPLQQVVGDASIVGLGEATHGTHEFFTIKQRVLEFLVEHMGFTTFALENGWDSSRLVDQYVLTGNGNLDALLVDDLYPTWQTQEVRDLIEWMRTYNATHSTKIHFAGIDCWSITQASFDDVVTYVQGVDPQQAGLLQALYADLRPTRTTPVFVDYGGYSAQPQATKERDRDNAQKAYAFLQAHQAVYESRSSKGAFALALQSAHVILQFAELAVRIAPSDRLFTSSPGYHYRDACMAQNVVWLHNHAGSTPKMLIWAHNLHIENTAPDFGTDLNMGAYLRQWYKQQYLAIGTSFYQGSFNALYNNSLTSYTVGPPRTNSYNYMLGSVGISAYLLDIRQTPPGVVTNWVQGPAELRLIGVFFDPTQQDQFYEQGSLQQWFDVIIHFPKTTATHSLS